METPSTPQRPRDPIERLKQNLSTKWALKLPSRPLFSSPSERDENAMDEKIYNCIQFLYYHKSFPERAALEYAIAKFEREAPIILSEWQFKPRSEEEVIPSQRRSSLGIESLQCRDELSDDASRELVKHLESVLSSVADSIRYNRPDGITAAVKMRSSAKDLSLENPTVTSLDTSQPSQQSLPSGFIRPYNTFVLADTQQIPPDEFMDSEINTVLESHSIPAERYELREAHHTERATKSSDDSANCVDHFVTPPTSPSYIGDMRSSLLSSNEKHTEDYALPNPTFLAPQKKRGRAESPSPTSRKLSRGLSDHSYVKLTATVTSFEDLDQMGALAGPSQSFEDLSSISSSMTSAFPICTSSNASFTISTENTSFDSLSGPTDTTARLQYLAPLSSQSDSKRPFTLNLKNESSGNVNAVDAGDNNTFESLVKRADKSGSVKQQTTLLPDFASRLCLKSPFVSEALVENTAVPFRQIYEVCRVAQASKIELSAFSTHLETRQDNYSSLWSSLSQIVKSHNQIPPKRSSLTSWERAVKQFQGVSLSAKLTFSESSRSSTPVFDIQYLPMKMEPSYRLSRHFGNDRFLVLAIPGLGTENLPAYLKAHAAPFRDAFVRWIVTENHQIFGRTWRAFYVRPESSREKGKGAHGANDTKFRIFLFAEDGQGFRQKPLPSKFDTLGEVDDRESPILDRPRSTVRQMIEWFMPFQQNLDKQSLKLFERLRLGLSSTVRTITFKPTQIVRTDDAFASSPCERRLDIRRSDAKKTGRIVSENNSGVMNDGCARISKLAASRIAAQLNLGYIPSVFQGRIGGAKGIWMVDALGEVPNPQDTDGPLWIEVTDSQQKFEASPIDSIQPDPDRVTFEVGAWSKELFPSRLNFQLIPILQDRGVSRAVFKELLTKDLNNKTIDLEVAMEDRLALRKWCHSNFPTTSYRIKNGGIKMLGGMPDSKEEKIIWFIDHGFSAKTCEFLKTLLFQVIRDHCLKLEDRLNIGLELSTNAYMIADPLNVLEENEVHVGFSGSFKDSQGFDQSVLHGVDILVARLPAQLPSDVQKVRAVFKPELRIYRDVVVFSSRGDVSLASKLSGGDYDGDRAWICWESSIVGPFKNATMPEQPPHEFYGITKDTTKITDILPQHDYVNKFLVHAFDFNLRKNLLGVCTSYHEAFCYARNEIDSVEAINLALLSGYLVDGPKNGFKFSNLEWAAFLKKMKQPQHFAKPAYKNRSKAKPTNHLIDDLVFNVARKIREEVLGTFDQKFKDVTTWDDDLVQPHKQETEIARSDKSLAETLARLARRLDEIIDYWKLNCPRTHDDYEHSVRNLEKKKDSGPSYSSVVQECRQSFLNIPPCSDEQSSALASDRIQQWTREHKAGVTSYWDLLKASVAFYKYHRYSSKCMWHIAGMELGELKARANGRGTYRTVVNPLYEALKPDGRLIDAARRREEEGIESQMDAEDNDDDDDDDDDDNDDDPGDGDEFGEWDWEDGFDG